MMGTHREPHPRGLRDSFLEEKSVSAGAGLKGCGRRRGTDSRQKSHGQRCGGGAACPRGNAEPEQERQHRAGVRGGKATPGRSGGRQPGAGPLHRGAGIPDGSVPRAHWPCRLQASSVVLMWGEDPMALVGTGQGCGAQDRDPATRNCLDAGSAVLRREPWAKASASMEGSRLGRGRAERPCIRSWAGQRRRRRLVTEYPPIPVAPMRAGRLELTPGPPS